MQFRLNVVFIATAFLASASLAMSVTINSFAGTDCTGTRTDSKSSNVPSSDGVCFSLGGASTKSISYSGVPNAIGFYISGGGHDTCTNGARLVLGSGSGCGTAPNGVNWESVLVI